MAYEDQTECESQVENGSGIHLQVDDEIEGVACWRCDDHDDGHDPFDEVGSEGCAERAS